MPQRWTALVVFAAALAAAPSGWAEPLYVYLTWQGDTGQTMTVNYHTTAPAASQVLYDTKPRGGDPQAYRHSADGAAHQIAGLPVQRWIHVAELTGLKPGGTYYFVAGDPEHGYSEERAFRTMPRRETPIRFVTGGDMGVDGAMIPLTEQAARLDPQFVLIGGDIAYVNGDVNEYAKWDAWFDQWCSTMITSDGLTIPMVLSIGNHETNRLDTRYPPYKAPFFIGYFAQEGMNTYFTRHFGQNIVLFVLDSGHISPHYGAQAQWLAQEMERNVDVKYKFALYHVPLYPSHRAFEGEWSRRGRLYWEGKFSKFGLTAAFENHDHTYKRSKRITNGELDPNGVLYIGDGCFGRSARTVEDELPWYLEKASSTEHFWYVEVDRDGIEFRAVDPQGNVFDTYRLPAE
jgi:acid phosphatase type 7